MLKSLQLHNLTNSCSSLFPYLYFGSQQLIFFVSLWLWQLVMLKKSFWNSSKQCTGKKFVKLQLCAVWWNPTTVFYTADMLHQNRRTVGRSINMFDFVLKVKALITHQILISFFSKTLNKNVFCFKGCKRFAIGEGHWIRPVPCKWTLLWTG